MSLGARSALLAALVIGVTLLGSGFGSAFGQAPDRPLRITDAWIRWLPDDLPAAGYVTLANLGNTPLTLIGASTPDYAAVMFHRSAANHGMEAMLPVESLAVPAHATVSFAPGSYHIMLMQPRRRLAPGDRVELTLHFHGSADRTVTFEVRGPDGKPVAP